ncbi:hypothetical protein [Sporosarcina ureae]|nr:hypothetical protein [Sporosarcina ureae]
MGNPKIGIGYCRKFITVKGLGVEQSLNYQQEAINQYDKYHGITIIK